MRLRIKLLIWLSLIIAGVILSRPLIDFFVNQNPLPGNNANDELSSERIRLMSPDMFLKLLNLQQGSTVLDLGAGFGMNTFRLGQGVGPTGKVFATDLDPKAIDFLKERIRKDGITNVFPVRVSGHGVDPFYSDHKFDLILISDVISEIRSPERFFDGLRPSLKEGTGRLWIVNLKLDPDFTAIEFGDSSIFRTALRSSPVQSTIVPRLSPAARQALAAPTETTSQEQFTELVIADLNKMLEDPTLWPEAKAKKWPLRQQDANLRELIVPILKRKGVFTTHVGMTVETRHLLRLLNRIIIIDLMGSDLWRKATTISKLSKSQLKPLFDPLTFSTFWEKPQYLEKVGYELVKEHKGFTCCNIWEFKRKR